MSWSNSAQVSSFVYIYGVNLLALSEETFFSLFFFFATFIWLSLLLCCCVSKIIYFVAAANGPAPLTLWSAKFGTELEY